MKRWIMVGIITFLFICVFAESQTSRNATELVFCLTEYQVTAEATIVPYEIIESSSILIVHFPVIDNALAEATQVGTITYAIHKILKVSTGLKVLLMKETYEWEADYYEAFSGTNWYYLPGVSIYWAGCYKGKYGLIKGATIFLPQDNIWDHRESIEQYITFVKFKPNFDLSKPFTLEIYAEFELRNNGIETDIFTSLNPLTITLHYEPFR